MPKRKRRIKRRNKRWKRVTPLDAFPRMLARKVLRIFIHHDVVPLPEIYWEILRDWRKAKKANDTRQVARLNNRLLDLEAAHMRTLDQIAVNRDFLGISYIFGVFPSGHIWMGRGFRRQGAHTLNWNSKAVGFVACGGNYSQLKPSDEMLDGFARISVRGMKRKRISFKAAVDGHRDVSATECPGNNLYAKLGAIRRRIGKLIDARNL